MSGREAEAHCAKSNGRREGGLHGSLVEAGAERVTGASGICCL